MDVRSSASLRQQMKLVRAQFLQSEGLPFDGVLSESVVERLLDEAKVAWTDRIYTPVVTTLVFLWQCLSADASCQDAVSKLIAHRVATGQKACSSKTGGYCTARQKLPESVVKGLARHAGQELDRQAKDEWRWKGRKVKVVDGSTASMPDTPENQAAYPQSSNQKPGVGFPIARILIIFSLAVGAALEMAVCPCKGKGQSELGLFRQLVDTFEPDDIMLADRFHCTWFTLASLRERRADGVARLHARRSSDFRRGRRLGKNDHIVQWKKPPKPDWMDQATYDALPEFLEVREVRLRVAVKGLRAETIIVATTLLDPEKFPLKDLTDLYRQRWQAELDLRSLKVTLGMDVLRCKTPEMVRKELWMHLLAYNLTRTVMAQAAATHDRAPRTLSFKASLQTLRAFQPHLESATPATVAHLAEAVLKALVQHQVGNRPDRVEPRARKRRPKPYPLLHEPRSAARSRLMKNPCS
jgi:IS4 transposase